MYIDINLNLDQCDFARKLEKRPCGSERWYSEGDKAQETSLYSERHGILFPRSLPWENYLLLSFTLLHLPQKYLRNRYRRKTRSEESQTTKWTTARHVASKREQRGAVVTDTRARFIVLSEAQSDHRKPRAFTLLYISACTYSPCVYNAYFFSFSRRCCFSRRELFDALRWNYIRSQWAIDRNVYGRMLVCFMRVMDILIHARLFLFIVVYFLSLRGNVFLENWAGARLSNLLFSKIR